MPHEIPPDPIPSGSALKQFLLRAMLVLIAVGVLIALYGIIRGEPLGETLSRILTTTLGVSFYAALALACADALEKKPHPLAHAGVAMACLAVALVFIGVWFDAANHEWWWKAFGVATVQSVCLWRAARVNLVELRSTAQLVVHGTVLALLVVAWIMSVLILREGQVSPMLGRILNAAWIIAIGGHVAIPILVRLGNR